MINKYLPCYAVEIIQTVDDYGVYKIYEATSLESAKNNVYLFMYEEKWESFEEAYAYALIFMMKEKYKIIKRLQFSKYNDNIRHKITIKETIKELSVPLPNGDCFAGSASADIEAFIGMEEFYKKETISYCRLFTTYGFSKAYVKLQEIIGD